MTTLPADAARNAIEWHKRQEARGESPWSCRLYDGEDSGPPERRCWLIPGHQCDCMTEAEARHCAQEDDFGILVIHPETDPLYARVVEILLAAREPAMPSLDAASGDLARFGGVLSTLDTLPDITTGYRPNRVEMSPDVWRFITGTEAPQHHRTPTHARHGGQRGDKAARKRQRKARKEQRK